MLSGKEQEASSGFVSTAMKATMVIRADIASIVHTVQSVRQFGCDARRQMNGRSGHPLGSDDTERPCKGRQEPRDDAP